MLPTQGDHSRFPPDALDEILAGVADAIDALGGSFTMWYTAVVLTATRSATAD